MKKIRIHPATWLFLIILLITGFASVIIPYLIAITLHELSHAFVAKKLGYCLNKVWILPYGACVSFEEFSFNPFDEIKIALAGPAMNAVLIIITIMLWWVFPSLYIYTYAFAISNFSIAIFNLLPAFPLDGGRVLTAILKTKFKNKTVYKVSCAINLIFSIIFLILFFVSAFIGINFSFGLIAVFLFMGIIEGHFQGKYSPMLAQFGGKQKQILPVKNFCVSSKTPLFKILPEINKHKYNVIYIRFPNENLKMLTETQLKKLVEKNSLEKTIEEIFNKENLQK